MEQDVGVLINGKRANGRILVSGHRCTQATFARREARARARIREMYGPIEVRTIPHGDGLALYFVREG